MEQLDKILRDKGVLLNESELSEVITQLHDAHSPLPIKINTKNTRAVEATTDVNQQPRMKPQPPRKQLSIIDKQNHDSSPLKRRSRGPASTDNKIANNSKLNLVEANSQEDAAVGIGSITKENDFLKWGQPKEQNSKFSNICKNICTTSLTQITNTKALP